MSNASRCLSAYCGLILLVLAGVAMAGDATVAPRAATSLGEVHYARRDGLKLYLWEKHLAAQDARAGAPQRAILLVHGGTWSGRPDFDLQIRDYSLMDALAARGYDVWALDIHGYGHSDRTDADASDVASAAADVGAAVEYIASLRGVAQVDLLGWSAGTQRVGVFAMQHPERVGRMVLYAPCWKGAPGYAERLRRRIDALGPAPARYRTNTAAAARSDFVEGPLAEHPQFEEDVVALYVREALQTDPESPNAFVDFAHLPFLDPTRIVVPTLVIFGEYDYFASEEDLVPFFQQLATRDKALVMLPRGGHALMLERGHRRFQEAVLEFLGAHR
jgi:pimeloyl-ACP methyl ester carboxylesterase